MGNENGEWIMHGVSADDPRCMHTFGELTEYINKVGFLPLFKNSVDGFSVEEITVPEHWWCDNDDIDPWRWRGFIANEGKVAYGKFFDKKAGFISLEWLPYFANWRRDGYDFDARWEDEKSTWRCKKIMDLFDSEDALFSYEIRRLAGFGKDGEKNFEGTVTDLMMQTYLVINGFKRRRNKAGGEYGWPIAVYTTPEKRWGYELTSSAYFESPAASKERIFAHMRELFPAAAETDIAKILK